MYPSLIQQANHIIPTQANATPIINSQPVRGSNNTNNIPTPTPIKTTPIVFFNAHIILLPPTVLYIILSFFNYCSFFTFTIYIYLVYNINKK